MITKAPSRDVATETPDKLRPTALAKKKKKTFHLRCLSGNFPLAESPQKKKKPIVNPGSL